MISSAKAGGNEASNSQENNKSIIKCLAGSQQDRGGKSAKPAPSIIGDPECRVDGLLIVVIAGKCCTRPWRVRKKERKRGEETQRRARSPRPLLFSPTAFLTQRLAVRYIEIMPGNSPSATEQTEKKKERKKETTTNEALQGITAQDCLGGTPPAHRYGAE